MKKKREDDDGRTVANMNVDGMPWYKSESRKKNEQEIKELNLTKKEKRAIMLATLFQTLKIIAIVVSAVAISFLLIWLWLS